MIAMLKAVFECMIEKRVTHVLAFLSPRLADSFSKLGCKHLSIRTQNPSAAVIESRRLMAPYFESQHAIPVVYDLEEMILQVGVSRMRIEDRLNSA